MIIDPNSGNINLGKNLIIRPGMRLSDLPQGVGTFNFGFLSVPLNWKYSEMDWSAGVHETKKLFRTKISKIELAADPYGRPITIDETDREEDTAIAYQRFLYSELGAAHYYGAEVKKYLNESIFVYLEYQYGWGKISCGWGVKEMLAHEIKIEYS